MTRSYAVKEMFSTLQGEGYHTGRAAVFVRFSGCNLWSGREEDRASATCRFCDTDFRGTDGVNGGRYDAVGLARGAAALWGAPHRPRFAVLTGGEPMLQVDEWLIDVFHRWQFEVAIETNGTIAVPGSVDWVTVSPKAGAPIVQASGHELKVVHPQDGLDPSEFARLDFRHFFLQPRDGPDVAATTRATVAYCLENPSWRLSLQSHKVLGIP